MPSQLFFGNGQSLVTRGNVAIYCYNALTARTWDVTSSENGSLTSSSVDTTTILEKYFSDFANEDGDMKIAENVLVKATPITDKQIGENQIVLTADANTEIKDDAQLAAFLGVKANVRNEKEKTHGTANEITAYVLESACDGIASLANKRVDVIFGKDNKVVYLAVVDEIVSNAYVTAWDNTDSKIEIDGEEYDVTSATVVSVFGEPVGTGKATIDGLFNKTNGKVKVTHETRTFDRNVIANIVLTDDEKIASIDFMFAENVTGLTSSVTGNPAIVIETAVVKSVSNFGIVKKVVGTFFEGREIENVIDVDKPRVVKNNELVSLEDVTDGDVLTTVKIGAEYKVIYISDAKVEGTITGVKNAKNIKVDGETYYSMVAPYANANGELDKAATTSNLEAYFNKDVEVYLTFTGEVAAVVADTDDIQQTAGIIKRVATDKIDNDEVEYLSIKILTNDNVSSTYRIYNERAGKNIDEASQYNTLKALTVGTLVLFSADEDRNIKSDEIFEPVAGTMYTVDGNENVELVVIPAGTYAVGADKNVNNDKQTIKFTPVGGSETTYRYSNSTVAYNTQLEKVCSKSCGVKGANTGCSGHDYIAENIETLSGWEALCSSTTTKFAEDQKLLVEDTKIRYFAGALTSYEAQTSNYAVLTEVYLDTDEDENTIYMASLVVNGNPVEYEIDSSKANVAADGDFIKYTLTDDVITDVTSVIKVADYNELKLNVAIGTTITSAETATAEATTTLKESLTVKEVDGDYVTYYNEVENPLYVANSGLDTNNDGKIESGEGTSMAGSPSFPINKYEAQLAPLYLEDDGYIIYDLRGEEVKMINDVNDIVDARVIGICSETNKDVTILVVVK